MKVTKVRKLVVDPCAGTIAMAKDCMLLLKHYRLVGRKVDSFSFGESLEGVMEVFARQLLSKESDIQGKETVQCAAMMLLWTAIKINARRRSIICDVLRVLWLTQTFPAHFIHFMPKKFKNPFIYNM